ncbi:MAG TPA: EAL domain-containing protein [Ilumatobacteraceae bacterium]|nr:EAL domain-containing protein [Ilumatobacteraceae bacterium]
MANIAGVDSRAMVDAAFRRAVVGMAITDAGGYYLEVNDAFCSLLGYSPEELLARSFRDITARDDLRSCAKAMRDLAEGRSSGFRFEKRYVIRAGGHLWARTTGIAVHDASGVLLRIIIQVEDLTLRRASEALLSRRESVDELTNLANRKTFYERLDAALALPRRSTRNLALLVVNLDRFHQVNAGLGHESGDTVLREVASRLTSVVRGEDVVARLGGDEFAVLSLGMRTPLDAVSLAIEIRHTLGRPYWSEGNAVYVSARVGVVANVEDSSSETLVQMASAATHQAKKLSGGWALHTEGANTSSHDELGLVSDLRAAIIDGNLTLAYQPVVDNRGAVQYVEALARWHHPERGSILPDQFIVLAERNGLIDALTTWVMTTAARQVAEWRSTGIDACVAVNLSGRLLAEPDLADRVASILHAAGVPAAMLILEITETAIAEGSNPAIRTALNALRSTGVRISIDDFGTGYSSLTYLKELPVDELKIDRSFILDLDTDARTERIVRSIIDLAHSLELTVVAEGVEDSAVANRLEALGVDYVQGYAIARPATASEITEWLRQRSTAVAAQIRQDERRGLDVLVVDSHPAERAALRKRLRNSKHRVAQAHSGSAALSKLKKKMPDVVILDHLMPGINGVETAPQLRAAGYAGPILLLSGSAPDNTQAARYPLDVWPVSHSDEALLVRLIDGYAFSPAPPRSSIPDGSETEV